MGNKLPSKAGESISMKEAKELAQAFQKKLKTKNKSTYYSLDVFERLMKVPGCVGIRIYPGLNNDSFAPLLIAVDANGDNIYYNANLVSSAAQSETALSSIEERGGACPPYCPDNDFL